MASLMLAGYVSVELYVHWLSPVQSAAIATGSELFNALSLAGLLAAFILYDEGFGAVASRGDWTPLIRGFSIRLVRLSAVVLAIAFAGAWPDRLPGVWIAWWAALSLCLAAITRTWLAAKLRSMSLNGRLTETVAIIGSGSAAEKLIELLAQTQTRKVKVLGIFDDAAASDAGTASKADGNFADLESLVTKSKIDWVLLTVPCAEHVRLQALVERLRPLGIPIGLCNETTSIARPDHLVEYVVNGVPVTLLADRPIKRWNAVIKSAEDLLLGWIATIMLLPVLALIGLLIKLDSPGPVLFTQRRHGYNNREFNIYKFRTMRVAPLDASEKLQQTSRNDPRITRIGRFLRASSLDELPQLFNVLEGEMSLVGPRPHAVNMRTEDRLCHEIINTYPHRHRVKPGITGWSQVNGLRGATDSKAQIYRRIEFDLHYVNNWSLLLDLKIFFMTVREVLRGTNAF